MGSSNPDTLFLSHFNFYYHFFSSVCINKVNLRVSYKENKGLKLYPVVTSQSYVQGGGQIKAVKKRVTFHLVQKWWSYSMFGVIRLVNRVVVRLVL